MATQAYRFRGEWPGGNRISRSDRAKVLDAVRDGTDVADPRSHPRPSPGRTPVFAAVLLGVATVWWFARGLPPRLVRIGDRAWAAEGFAQRLVARGQNV